MWIASHSARIGSKAAPENIVRSGALPDDVRLVFEGQMSNPKTSLEKIGMVIDAGLKLRTLRLPDVFQDQDKPEKQYAEAGLDADGIVNAVLTALRHNSAGVNEAIA